MTDKTGGLQKRGIDTTGSISKLYAWEGLYAWELPGSADFE